MAEGREQPALLRRGETVGVVETVGGLLSGISGKVPAAGSTLYHSGLQFDVEKADDRRVLAVRVRRPGMKEIPIG